MKKEPVINEIMRMSPTELCTKCNIQNCDCCDSPTCGDNTSPLRREVDKLRAAQPILSKKEIELTQRLEAALGRNIQLSKDNARLKNEVEQLSKAL